MAATATASSVLLRQQQQDPFMPIDMTTPTSKGSSAEFLPRSQALQEHSHHSHNHHHHSHQHSNDQSPPPAGVVATADALFEAIHLQNHNHNSHLAPHAHPPQTAALSSPVAVSGHQLPTPRTSISSGASSPPELMSPNSRPSQHQQQTPSSFSSYPHTTSFASPSSSDVQSSIASPLHNPHVQHLKASSLTNQRQPMGPSHLHNSGKYNASPALNTKLGQSQSGPSSPATSSAIDMDGSSFSTLAGRSVASHAHVDESDQVLGHAHYPSHYEQHQQQQQQYQHQLQLQEQHDLFLADEKETQKKNARSALNGASSYLPPGLNHTLNKVVQSAKEAVGTTHVVLPSTHRPLTSTSLGSSNGGVYSSQPRIGTRSVQHLVIRLYRASKLPLICLSWYMSSAVTNNLGKQLMNQFRYPVTLTFVQFWFVSLFCYIAGTVFKMTKIRKPSRMIFEMTGPLVVFQVIGHVFSSVAISRVPLSVVHTIKALTPLFTVLFYRVVLGTTYSRAVYLSLVPLTAGVMLACRLSLEFNNMVGLLSALLSTLVFVTQNVFTKKILSSAKSKQQQQQEQHGHGGLANKESIAMGAVDPVEQLGGSNAKLDKINILFYSSTMAAIFMIPMWLYTEGWTLMFTEEFGMGHHAGVAANGGWSVSWLLFTNSVSHFFQNVFAFSVLALTSPVTYSIASLIKRIVVIVASIVYFHQTLGTTQWTGVCLTFWGLWLYNSAKNAAKVDPSAGILKGTSMGKRMSKNFGRGLLDEDNSRDEHKKSGFIV
ncbi:suppressor of loss of ypt1 [Podila clonocystis]|nr:suppressor of loss of ypt1 [Podila clonocystis]